MAESLILPKTNYPNFCPGSMQECARTECDITYDWRNVFVSIPYSEWYSNFRQEIELRLHKAHFNPIFVERDYKPVPLPKAIAKNICKSAHAIIDLSPAPDGQFAGGVLLENGFLRSTMNKDDILITTRSKSRLPAEANALKYESYNDKLELGVIIDEWLKKIKESSIDPITWMLFNSKNYQNWRYEVWYHCLGPTCDVKKQKLLKRLFEDPRRGDTLLSGGWSGYELIRNTFDSFKSDAFKKAKIVNFGRCFVKNENEWDGQSKPQLSNNLYLLDAPISRGADFREKRLNWIMYEVLELLMDRLTPAPSIKMEILDPTDPTDADLLTACPNEVKKLTYNHGEYLISTPAWDYGFILRVPNPFCHDSKAFVIIMAGLHAPATHAAAEIFTVPSRARHFAEFVRSKQLNLLKIDFFEAVFEVRKTYYKDDLGKIRWLHFRQLREKEK